MLSAGVFHLIVHFYTNYLSAKIRESQNKEKRKCVELQW